MSKILLPDIGGKQVSEIDGTREYAVKNYRIILNWKDQTATIIAGDYNEVTIPIFLVAFILQHFGGFHIELNAMDWTGPKGIWAKAAEEARDATRHYRSDTGLSRDWVEDAAHENGDYQNKCSICRHYFIGHKRRVVCKLCASAAAMCDNAATQWSMDTDSQDEEGNEREVLL